MRRTMLLSLAILPVAAPAQIDYSTFEAKIVIRAAEIRAHTGQTTADFTTIGTAPDGRVYLYTRAGAADTNAKLVAVDVSGPSPVFETIATQADLLPHLDSVAPWVYNLSIDASGIVYLQEYVLTGQIDDILRIVPGTPPTVTNRRRINGISGVMLNNAGDSLYICQVDNYLASSNNFVRIGASSGTDVVVASQAAITAVTGASQAGLRTRPVEASNGDLLVWDEFNFQGSDQLLRITPAGAVTVAKSTAAWDGGVTGGVTSLGIDQHDTVFAFDTNPSNTIARLMILEDAGAGPTTKIPKSDIDAALVAAHGGFYPFNINSFGNNMAVHSTVEQTTLYFANVSRNDVVAIVFSEPATRAADWTRY